MLHPIFLYTFITCSSILVVYYIVVFSRFSFCKKQKHSNTVNTPVSVIICAKNEAENLKENLDKIIEQDYPNFEIVLINDASRDETLDVMEAFEAKHANIKIVNVLQNENFWGNKKYALTLGIKAASHEHLIFTDADCTPNSKQWIQEVASQFSEDKTIVLGYGAYAKIPKSILNCLIRFETIITAIQYFSYAKSGNPYMGVGRNIAYTKTQFFSSNGFVNHIGIRSGDDDLFVNENANKKNTAICFTQESHTISSPCLTFGEWIRQKRRHISTAHHYKFKDKIALGLFYITQLVFWISLFTSLLFKDLHIIIGIVFGIKLVIQYVVYGYAAKKLNEQRLIIALPFLELFLIVFQLLIFITNRFSKPVHWK